MKAIFYSNNKRREKHIAEALRAGLRKHGDDLKIVPISSFNGPDPKFDLSIMYGVKSAKMFHPCRKAGQTVILMDKGYHRVKGPGGIEIYTRASINAFQPLDYFMRERRPIDRWKKIGIPVSGIREYAPEDKILYAGSSQKYCDFHGLGNATEYAKNVIAEIKRYTSQDIVYRPKPSWKDATLIPGTEFSPGSVNIGTVMRDVGCLVTHGSNICLDAVCAGVPVITLGPGITRPISSGEISDVVGPYRYTHEERMELLSAVAYCQFTLEEMKNGYAWSILKPEIERERA